VFEQFRKYSHSESHLGENGCWYFRLMNDLNGNIVGKNEIEIRRMNEGFKDY